jgi:hypothetical protein
MVEGRRRDIGLGGFSYTSLVEARARARLLRKIAREGRDPLVARAQVCRTELPEATQARNHALMLLKKAGVVVEDSPSAELGEADHGTTFGLLCAHGSAPHKGNHETLR